MDLRSSHLDAGNIHYFNDGCMGTLHCYYCAVIPLKKGRTPGNNSRNKTDNLTVQKIYLKETNMYL